MSVASLVSPLFYDSGELSDYAAELCQRFNLSRCNIQPTQPYLRFVDAQLALFVPDSKFKPVTVDFLAGKNRHRQQFGGGKSQLICKAVGVSAQFKPSVLDMTAGLGGDAFALAAVGCKLHLQERNPYAAALVYDGVKRLEAEGSSLQMTFHQFVDSRTTSEASVAADVVYLDPMYPDTKNKAAANKAMTIFHDLVGKDIDAAELLPVAKDIAEYRVVVKRPKKGQLLGGEEPTYQLDGKSSRYDIYVNKGLSNR